MVRGWIRLDRGEYDSEEAGKTAEGTEMDGPVGGQASNHYQGPSK